VDSEPKPDLENPHREEKRPKDLDLSQSQTEPEPEPELEPDPDPDAEQRKMCVNTSCVNTLLWVSNADRVVDLLPT
jgi:hypothetical protein